MAAQRSDLSQDQQAESEGSSDRSTRGLRVRTRYLIQAIDSLYYLCHATDNENRRYIANVRSLVNELPSSKLQWLHGLLEGDMQQLKAESGCVLTDRQIRHLVRAMTSPAEDGWIYVPKFVVEHWFSNYTRVFPRWPHIPHHSLVMFDSDPDRDSPYTIWLAESALLGDARRLCSQVEQIVEDGKDFRTRPKEEHKTLHTLMRAAATTIYQFLEAYLNGLAFNCVHTFGKRLSPSQRRVLTEWDSRKKRRRFVSFDRKLTEYPAIYGEYLNRVANLAPDKDVALLTSDGKLLRDGLTHPSLFAGDRSYSPEKIVRIITLSHEQVENLLRAATAYVRKTEKALGRDPKLSVPWLEK